jgi:hypothetical protein
MSLLSPAMISAEVIQLASAGAGSSTSVGRWAVQGAY